MGSGLKLLQVERGTSRLLMIGSNRRLVEKWNKLFLPLFLVKYLCCLSELPPSMVNGL